MSKYNLYIEDVSVEAVFNKLGGIEGARRFLRGEAVTSPFNTSHLRFLEAVELPATAGTTTIAQSNEVFTGYFDPNFKNWDTDVASPDTMPAMALVYEVARNGNFNTLFSSLGTDWLSKLPTQGQVVAFCQEHPDKLRHDGYGTFFPFQVEGQREPLVALVFFDAGQLEVSVGRLGHGDVWHADNLPRVVVLQ